MIEQEPEEKIKKSPSPGVLWPPPHVLKFKQDLMQLIKDNFKKETLKNNRFMDICVIAMHYNRRIAGL